MEYIATIYLNNLVSGTIARIPRNLDDSFSLWEQNVEKSVLVRDPNDSIYVFLRNLDTGTEKLRFTPYYGKEMSLESYSSTLKHIILNEKTIMIDGSIFEGFIPENIRWKVMISADNKDIYSVPKELQNNLGKMFCDQGYTKQYISCHKYIVLPEHMLSKSCQPLDLLLTEEDGKIYPISGRKLVNELDIDRIEGKAVYINSVPEFEGNIKSLPFTFSLSSLYNSDILIQGRAAAKCNQVYKVLMKKLDDEYQEKSTMYRKYRDSLKINQYM